MNEPAGGASGAAAAEPDTPGGMLRVERERRGYSVQHAAEDMHLDAWVIQAIEANRFEALGAPVYARGHLRKYAALLGLSPATVIERYEALGGTPVEPTPIPAAIAAPVLVERRRVSKLPLWIAAAIAVVAGLAWLVFELLWTPSSDNATTSEVVAPTVSEPVSEPVEQAQQEPAAAAPAPVAQAPAVAATSAASGEVRLRLEFTEPSWAEIYDASGKRLMFDMGTPGRVRTVAGVPPLRVNLGMASAVNAQVGDRPIVIPRRAGQGRRKVFDRGGWLSETGYFEDGGARVTQQQIQPPRGMNDVLPADIAGWHRLEGVARELFAAYGYQEIRVPIVEHTALFKRSIGEFTDIVQKEMFTFEDPGGDSLTLRPEATAGIVRAMISNGLLHNQRQRVWCAGPMFRYERPQAGRFRQFYQLDAEAFGFPGPDIDAELIMLSARLLRTLGLQRIELHLNSLGTPASRRAYREKLVEYFTAHKSRLDADSLRRLEGNPLRILDSKNPELQDVIAGCAGVDRVPGRGVAPALLGAVPASRRSRDPLRPQSAPGARARLLYAHGFRVADDGAWIARRRVLRRSLRRHGRAARGREHARHRLGAWVRNASCRCCAHRTARRRDMRRTSTS